MRLEISSWVLESLGLQAYQHLGRKQAEQSARVYRGGYSISEPMAGYG
jgi:hypothetical protein